LMFFGYHHKLPVLVEKVIKFSFMFTKNWCVLISYSSLSTNVTRNNDDDVYSDNFTRQKL
jgi:hypothetical protein